MTIEVETKQWGNSTGIIIPKEVIDELNIQIGDSVLINIEKKTNPLKELFGSIKLKKNTKQILKETRKDLEGQLI